MAALVFLLIVKERGRPKGAISLGYGALLLYFNQSERQRELVFSRGRPKSVELFARPVTCAALY